MKKETFQLTILDKTVEVYNEGTHLFSEQTKEANNELKEFLESQLKENKTDGWLPYNNFESSITWKVI